jgi:hypothetical protein
LLASGFGDKLEAWSFDRENTQWTAFPPGGAPQPGVEYMKAAYDRLRGTALAFGYYQGTTLMNFDPTTGVWSDESPTAPPASWPPDNYIGTVGGMTYDAARETLVIVFRDGRVVERPSK